MTMGGGGAGSGAHVVPAETLAGPVGSVEGQQQSFGVALSAAAGQHLDSRQAAKLQLDGTVYYENNNIINNNYNNLAQSEHFSTQPPEQQLLHQAAAQFSSPASDQNGPMLFTEPNRTSAIDDIRSGAIYIFVITVFVSFLLILPGIRSDKLPTFICVTSSLLVTSIILIGLFGTTWHVGEAPEMSAAYKAFSRDRIQGELTVNIGLQSVNITLRAHKYYIMHQLEGPLILMDASRMLEGAGLKRARGSGLLASLMPLAPVSPSTSETAAQDEVQELAGEQQGASNSSSQPPEEAANSGAASRFIEALQTAEASGPQGANKTSLADELLLAGGSRLGPHASAADVDEDELESEQDIFSSRGEPVSAASSPAGAKKGRRSRVARSSSAAQAGPASDSGPPDAAEGHSSLGKSSNQTREESDEHVGQETSSLNSNSKPKYTIKRVSHVDINYNERFYWIEPQQMRREYYKALQRGLPYPILTVVEYLSQDEAGFNWSRQYRLAGYYTSLLLWLSAALCALMFCLHCAAPKYGIYTMQLLGLLLLFTNFTYSKLVPSGDKELVIPFEGHSLAFRFGWNFWLVLFGGKSISLSLC